MNEISVVIADTNEVICTTIQSLFPTSNLLLEDRSCDNNMIVRVSISGTQKLWEAKVIVLGALVEDALLFSISGARIVAHMSDKSIKES